MKVLKGYVFRLYPNVEQKTLINKTIGFVRLIYNIFLSDRIDTYNNTKNGKFAYDHFCKQGGFPKFKAKGVKDSYKTNNVVSTYKEKVYNSIELDLEKRLIKLPKLKWRQRQQPE